MSNKNTQPKVIFKHNINGFLIKGALWWFGPKYSKKNDADAGIKAFNNTGNVPVNTSPFLFFTPTESTVLESTAHATIFFFLQDILRIARLSRSEDLQLHSKRWTEQRVSM